MEPHKEEELHNKEEPHKGEKLHKEEETHKQKEPHNHTTRKNRTRRKSCTKEKEPNNKERPHNEEEPHKEKEPQKTNKLTINPPVGYRQKQVGKSSFTSSSSKQLEQHKDDLACARSKLTQQKSKVLEHVSTKVAQAIEDKKRELTSAHEFCTREVT